MSQAYKCNQCEEYYDGEPAVKNYMGYEWFDICPRCKWVMEQLSSIDPLHHKEGDNNAE